MTQPSYDVVLYGATGFTGRQAAWYFAENVDSTKVRWALAGRNLRKLETLKANLGPDFEHVDLLVADSTDLDSVERMVSKTRVLLTTAGPYALYGKPIVAACVKHGVDYVDITGETPFVRDLIDEHHAEAESKGIKIIPFCGFDSVPSDLGALFVVEHMKKVLGQPCKEVKAFFKMKSGLNGGTLASVLNLLDSRQLEQLADPFLLNPSNRQSDEERKRNPDQKHAQFDKDLGRWTAPFLMAPVNTRVVRRSHALFSEYGSSYGNHFSYHESLDIGEKKRFKASMIASGQSLFEGLGKIGGVRSLLRRMGPKPGEGPTEAEMNGGFFRCILIGKTEDGQIVRARMQGAGDPGNRNTVKMLCESALCLALQRDELPGGARRGGILTPATGLGFVLIERLKAAGVSLEIEEG